MLTTIVSLLILVFAFGVLIFVHELGHFLAAKWAGIRTEAFAVGMGPVVFSWRRGVGCRVGSTDRALVDRFGKTGSELDDEALQAHGIGETEYSLRALPLGGFVKMLGQEDGKPVTEHADPRSYAQCPVWKRMIVVSAGVIMNVLLAFVLFAIAFQVGVRSPAPVVGEVSPTSPAARAVASNAEALGVTRVGLQPGDRVLTTDGSPVRTFSDLTIAAAMSRAETAVALSVQRPGIPEALEFAIVAEAGASGGLLSFGISESRSTILFGNPVDAVTTALEEAGLAAHGVEPGMRMIELGGEPIENFTGVDRIASEHGAGALESVWIDAHAPDRRVTAPIEIVPRFDVLIDAERAQAEVGLLGFVPLVEVARVSDAVADILEPGDLMLGTGDIAAPRMSQMVEEIQRHSGSSIELVVLRGDAIVTVTADVGADGKVGFNPQEAFWSPRIATPMPATHEISGERPTAAARTGIPPGAEIVAIDESQVGDWYEFHAALLAATQAAAQSVTGTDVSITWRPPTSTLGDAPRTARLELTAEDVARVHGLGWRADLPEFIFQANETMLSSDGNVFRAIAMGFKETHKVITLTYLTIDRLFRGSVGVDQLRGPVGIIDLGTRILPRGLMYFLFFQGLISVNLAVINFLPLPIVDGGLFLFLIYEKFKGRPPSIRFQNIATVTGLCLIGTIFIVTFYNDIMRIVQG